MSSDADGHDDWLEEDEDDATMELSIADVLSLKHEDTRGQQAQPTPSSPSRPHARQPSTHSAPYPPRTTRPPGLETSSVSDFNHELEDTGDFLDELDDIIAQSFTDETSHPVVEPPPFNRPPSHASLEEETNPSVTAPPSIQLDHTNAPATIPVDEYIDGIDDPLQDELRELDGLLQSGMIERSVAEDITQEEDPEESDGPDTSVTNLEEIPSLDFEDLEELSDGASSTTHDSATSMVSVGTLAGLDLGPPTLGDQASEFRVDALRAQTASGDDFEEEDDHVDASSSTSVVKPTRELIEASKQWESQWDNAASLQDDATGHFEIPAALILESRATDPKQSAPTKELRAINQPGHPTRGDSEPEYTSELSKPINPELTIEAFATVDEQGRLVLPGEMVSLGPLEPGMRVRLRIDVIEE